MRLLTAACLAVLLPASAGALTLDEATETALRNDPELKALERQLAASELEADAAARLLADNPSLSVGGGYADAPDDSGFEYSVGIEQPLQLGGQQTQRRRAARAAIDRAGVQALARRQILGAEVRMAFVQTLAAKERQALAVESRTLAEEAAEAARQQFEAGKISRLARNSALVELARAARDAAEAVVALDRSHSDLRALLGLEAEHPVEVEGSLAHQRLPAGSPLAEALEQAGGRRQELRAAVLARQEAQARRRLAEAAAVPDLIVGVGAERELDTDRLQATLSIPIPIFQRNEADRAAALREEARAQAELVAAERQVMAEVERAAARLQEAAVAAAAFQAEAVEALEENLRLASDAFREGDIDYVAYLLLRREALEGRAAWIDALEEVALAQAAWERALGLQESPEN